MNAPHVTPEAFRPYGRVVLAPTATPTASDPSFRYWSDLAHYGVEGETEIGLCTVYRQEDDRVAWMERHDRTPEILIPVDAPFVLPVMDGAGRVEAFRVDPGEAVVIDPGVWHSACRPVGAEEATYFVLFRRGTPAEDVVKRDV
jgi:ureidoglycolate lyase